MEVVPPLQPLLVLKWQVNFDISTLQVKLYTKLFNDVTLAFSIYRLGYWLNFSYVRVKFLMLIIRIWCQHLYIDHYFQTPYWNVSFLKLGMIVFVFVFFTKVFYVSKCRLKLVCFVYRQHVTQTFLYMIVEMHLTLWRYFTVFPSFYCFCLVLVFWDSSV